MLQGARRRASWHHTGMTSSSWSSMWQRCQVRQNCWVPSTLTNPRGGVNMSHSGCRACIAIPGRRDSAQCSHLGGGTWLAAQGDPSRPPQPQNDRVGPGLPKPAWCVCVCVGLLIRGCGARSGWVLASCVCSFGRQAVAKHKAAQGGLRRLPEPVISVHRIAFDTYSIGLAAGFDKSAEGPEALLNLGFGFVEIGEYPPSKQRQGVVRRLPMFEVF